MSSEQSRSDSNLDDLYARLDEVRMSSHERLRAKARLAQTEAIVDAVGGLFNLVKRVFKGLAVRPLVRLIKLAG